MNSIKDMLDAGREAFAADKRAEAAAEAQREQQWQALKDLRFAPLAEAIAQHLPPPLFAHADLGRDRFESATQHAVHINIPGMVTFKAWFHLHSWTDRERDIGEWGLTDYRIPVYERYRGDEDVVVAAREHEWPRTNEAHRAVALAFDAEHQRQKLQLECVTANALAADRRALRIASVASEPSLEERLIAALRAWVLDVVPVPAE